MKIRRETSYKCVWSSMMEEKLSIKVNINHETHRILFYLEKTSKSANRKTPEYIHSCPGARRLSREGKRKMEDKLRADIANASPTPQYSRVDSVVLGQRFALRTQ